MEVPVTSMGVILILIALFNNFEASFSQNTYHIDSSIGLGRRFDGIGAISGGGATSRLLVNYPEPQRSEILDYLFKPDFGASLHIFKVEIGGDAQSSEGTETSHMHDQWDENYHRGYEWWMMKEAKKRNPEILLYGLPWGFPGWLGDGAWWPFNNANITAHYIINWIQGAKKFHNLTIDYIGLWNEKPYDIPYVKILRNQLNVAGLNHVKIVAADMIGSDAWDVVKDMAVDKKFNQSIDIVGGHYTWSTTTDEAKLCGKPLWSSEDATNGAGEKGGACFAKLLNQNYVKGLMTSTIAWNVLAAYYDNLPYGRASLMTSNEPWSGYYEVTGPIWAAAHTTQFVQPGWHYLDHNAGVGFLKYGGTYVSLVSPDSKDFTLIIETTVDWNAVICHVKALIPSENTSECKHIFGHRRKKKLKEDEANVQCSESTPYAVHPQRATFVFKGKLTMIKYLNIWHTSFKIGRNSSEYLRNMGKIQIVNGSVTLDLQLNEVYTLTTLTTGHRGDHGNPPPPGPFPQPYHDNFENYPLFGEANDFAQQVGAFEVRDSGDPSHGHVMRQVVQRAPVHWCPLPQTVPLSVIGNYSWTNVKVSVDVHIPSVNGSTGVFLAAGIDQGGCTTYFAQGLFFFLLTDGSYVISTDLVRTKVVNQGSIAMKFDTWYSLTLTVKDSNVVASVNGNVLYSGNIPNKRSHGFLGLGTNEFKLADFDNFAIGSST